MSARQEQIELPNAIRAFLIEMVGRKMSRGGRAPQPSLDGLPGSMQAGQVQRLCQGGPFGWLLDARLDRIEDRMALEVCENSRMAGVVHYRVWDDGSVQQLPTERAEMVFPAGCSKDEEERIRQEYFAHNRAVHELLAGRGFR